MDDITGVVTAAGVLFTAITGLGVIVLGWSKGRKLFNKGV